MDEIKEFIIFYQDYGAPQLDVYEQAIYLYVFRHTLIEGTNQAVIGFKSARKKMAFGIGRSGTPPSETVVYEKLRSLERKGFIRVLSSERTGTRIGLLVPFLNSKHSLASAPAAALSLDDADFFNDELNRKLILARDKHQCFYCSVVVDENNYVIEHVISRPKGDNSYKNLVASCRQCNNRKDAMPADQFLRKIYREGIVSQAELTDRLQNLEQLAAGNIKPTWPVN